MTSDPIRRPVRHARAVADGVTTHYVVTGEGPPLVLLHGFPQNWREWEPSFPLLADRFTLIVPDLRGLGGFPGPATGYDLFTMARDVRAAVDRETTEPVTFCGHDMGSFVGLAYALSYRDAVSSLVLVDAPLPGTALGDTLETNPKTWHIPFHMNADVAHMLIHGREREYLEFFIGSRLIDPDVVPRATMDAYVRAYSAPGALRAALEMYRALPENADRVRAHLARDGRLTMPVVYAAGAQTSVQADLQGMVDELAVGGRVAVIENTGHYVPEEQPAALARVVVDLAASVADARNPVAPAGVTG
ncbi:alpha/beta fold hydrolase [Pseudonocardia dioxanivorans]|jgi:pimeloyl-ACP methyl ester carboxylesterase|uniref:alpha/beta fold hydrolase n=1 Tax=Pseudonocardia dioxanivorans TaxID=240495 RepID=UPI000CD023FA|nr:alpha/beta hydrolase [Pseudonocardia dioxanivorans]